jgi:hypothetical protein
MLLSQFTSTQKNKTSNAHHKGIHPLVLLQSIQIKSKCYYRNSRTPKKRKQATRTTREFIPLSYCRAFKLKVNAIIAIHEHPKKENKQRAPQENSSPCLIVEVSN